jgi:hypothetical protein
LTRRSLILHIGMPRTGTCSLQRLLAGSSPILEEAGYQYPDLELDEQEMAHHALGLDVLAHGGGSRIGAELLERVARAEGNTIVSTETLSNGLADAGFDALRSFLTAAMDVVDVEVVIVLRRMDQMLASMYLFQVRNGDDPEAVDQFSERRLPWVDQVFGNLRDLRLSRDWPSPVILTYRPGRDSTAPVLRAMGIDPAALGEAGRSLHRTLGLKAQAFLGGLSELGDGVPVARRELIHAFETGRFSFSDEVFEYDPFGYEARRRIHEHALASSVEHGIHEYEDAYRGDRIEPTPRTEIDSSLITDADLRDLRRFLSAAGRED